MSLSFRRRLSAPIARTANRSIARFDLGGSLSQVLPALQVPYIAVQEAAPLRFDDLASKNTTKIQENIGKMDDDLLKIRQDTLKDLDLLPEDQRYFMQKLDNFSGQLYQQSLKNPQFFMNAANVSQVKNQLLQLTSSEEVKVMKQRAADARKFRDNVYKEGLQNNVFRSSDGKDQGFSNDEYINTIFNESGERVQKMWGVGQDPNRRRGQLELNSYTGTDKQLDDSLDQLSGLVKASKISRSAGGYQLDPSVSARFESLYPGIRSYLNSKSGEQNTDPLQALAGYWGSDWKSKLERPAAQALEDKMYNQYRSSAFGSEFKLKGGRAFGGNAASVSDVEQLAREGKLEDSKGILAKINAERNQYIQQKGSEYIVKRVMGRQYSDQASASNSSIAIYGTGSLRKALGEKEKSAEPNYERGLYEGIQDGVVTQVRGSDNKTTNSYIQVSPTVGVRKDRQTYVGMSAVQAGFGREFVSLANPNQNLLGGSGLKNADLIKVRSYDGDILSSDNTSPALQQAQQAYLATQRQIAEIDFKVKMGNQLLPSEMHKLAQAQAQLPQALASLNAVTAQEKRAPLHKLTVVMPASVLKENVSKFSYQDKDGQTKQMYDGRWGIGGLPSNVYQDQNEVDNPYGIKRVTLSDEEKKKLGFDPNEDEFVQMDAAVNGRVQDMFQDKEQKGVNAQIGAERAAGRQGEINKNESAADWLNQFK